MRGRAADNDVCAAATDSYDRIRAFGKQYALHALFGTYIIDSMWHGYYPGYFMFFISWALLLNVVGTEWRKTFEPTEKEGAKHWMYEVTAVIALHATKDYLCAPFLMLSLEESWKIWKSMHFCIHIAGFVVCAVAVGVRALRGAPHVEKKKD